MQFATVQFRPVRGDVAANLVAHLHLAQRATTAGARLVVFPELSLSGYEQSLARSLAVEPADRRLLPLQQLADTTDATLVVGVPLRTASMPHIGLLLFAPNRAVTTYSKHHLHPDELPFFTPGPVRGHVLDTSPKVALAICYELSVPQHAAFALSQGASVYCTSVAKSPNGVAAASTRLSALAREHGWVTSMANCIGPADGFHSAGGSAVWDQRGECVAALGPDEEGILVYDTASDAVPRIRRA